MMRLSRFINSEDAIFYAMFFVPLIGTSIFAYAFVLLFFLLHVRRVTIRNQKSLFLGVLIASFCILKLFQMGSLYDWTVVVRYYFGWSLFLFYLSYKNYLLKSFDLFLKCIIIEIICEAILINFFVSPTLLPNYPHHEFAVDFDAAISTVGYQRPYSFGNNATVSSTILCMLLATRDVLCNYEVLKKNTKIDLFGGLAMIVLASGTGLFLYTLYLCYKYRNIFNLKTLSAVIAVVVILIIALSNSALGETILFRFGLEALSAMYDFKMEEIANYVQTTHGQNTLIGVDFKDIPLLTQGDLAWVEMYYSIGIVGILILLYFVQMHLNSVNWIPILIGLAGVIHYGGILSEPGQLILAYLALMTPQSISELRMKDDE